MADDDDEDVRHLINLRRKLRAEGRDINDYFVEQTVHRAESGDYDAAIKILVEFIDEIEIGRLPNQRYLEYFARCFDQVLGPQRDGNGIRVDRALGLEKPPHRRRDPDKPNRDSKLATEVMRRVIHGWKRGKAIDDVAERFGVKIDTVRKAYDDPAWKRAAEIKLGLDAGNKKKSGHKKK